MEKGTKEMPPIPLVVQPSPRQLSPLADNVLQVFLTLPKHPKPALRREPPACPAMPASRQIPEKRLQWTERTGISPLPEENMCSQGRILPAAPTRCTTSLTSLGILSCTAPCAVTTSAGRGSRLNQCPKPVNATSLDF